MRSIPDEGDRQGHTLPNHSGREKAPLCMVRESFFNLAENVFPHGKTVTEITPDYQDIHP
jgi:hypothetical protein